MSNKLYIEDYTDFSTGINIGEYYVKFPDKPNMKDMVNYGKKAENQHFVRTTYTINGKTFMPSQLVGDIWDMLPDNSKKEIHAREMEYLMHGRWYLINGKTIYINGFMYDFLNYYKPNTLDYGQFWDSQWMYMLLMQDSFFADDVLALLYIKGRRGGGTAVNNGAVMHVSTMIRNSMCGLMNYNIDQSIKVNFNPIKANIFKLPDFRLPHPYLDARRNNTIKRLKGTDQLFFEAANNSIYTTATKESGFDGTLQRLSIIDECYKWANTDPMVTLEKNVLCIKDGGIKNNIKDKDTGKPLQSAGLCVFVSSVDEISDEQIATVNTMWDSASPETAIDGLCSMHGARRYFEPAAFGLNGFMDAYGFSLYEKAEKKINDQYENILKNQGYDKAREFKRKSPLSIEDALVPSSQICQFNFEILSRALLAAKEMALDDPRRPIYCQLEWVDYMKTVRVVPKPEYREFCEQARFCISGYSETPNNISTLMGNVMPMSKGVYLCSLDPIDYDKKSLAGEKYSKPAFRVKRLLDMRVDGTKFDAKGNPINYGEGFETNRTVLTYKYRPQLTATLLDDIAKTLIYYGCPLAFERNTRTIYDYMERNSMSAFILDSKGVPINSSTKDDYGIKTTEATKRSYFDFTRNYIDMYGLAERHEECLSELIKTTPENMTKNDLSAAYMIGEYIDTKQAHRYKSVNRLELKIKEHFNDIIL